MFAHQRKSAAVSGFTLIELLVVISIIAVLAAILFPVFAKVREKARQTACMSNMKQLGLGVMQYTQDNDEIYPCGWRGQTTDISAGQMAYWPYAIFPYVKNYQVYKCPDALHGNDVAVSYLMNNSDYLNSAPIAKVDAPADIILLIEGSITPYNDAPTKHTNSAISGNGLNEDYTMWVKVGRVLDDGHARHTDHVNIAFADGHVHASPALAGHNGNDPWGPVVANFEARMPWAKWVDPEPGSGPWQ